MKNIFLVFLIVFGCSLFAIEYNSYKMVIEYEFKASYRGQDNEMDLAVEYGTQGIGPRGPAIYYSNDHLIISDQLSNRTIITNKDYSFLAIEDKCFFEDLVSVQNGIEVGINYYGVRIRDNGELIVEISSSDIPFMNTVNSALYYEKYLFIHDKNNKLLCIKDPSMDVNKNKSSVINEEETIKLINSGVLKGLTIDSEKRVFVNGELKTLNYPTYIKYWTSRNPDITGSIRGYDYTSEFLKGFKFDQYLGVDLDNNYYWGYWGAVMIFSMNGYFLDLFLYDQKLSDAFPAVSPDGDVYFIKHGEDKVTLYKIEREW